TECAGEGGCRGAGPSRRSPWTRPSRWRRWGSGSRGRERRALPPSACPSTDSPSSPASRHQAHGAGVPSLIVTGSPTRAVRAVVGDEDLSRLHELLEASEILP